MKSTMKMIKVGHYGYIMIVKDSPHYRVRLGRSVTGLRLPGRVVAWIPRQPSGAAFSVEDATTA